MMLCIDSVRIYTSPSKGSFKSVEVPGGGEVAGKLLEFTQIRQIGS